MWMHRRRACGFCLSCPVTLSIKYYSYLFLKLPFFGDFIERKSTSSFLFILIIMENAPNSSYSLNKGLTHLSIWIDVFHAIYCFHKNIRKNIFEITIYRWN
jgi:hypothetical protein